MILEIYEGTFGLLKAPWWPPAPFTTGHEASGVIDQLGSGLLGDWKVGQRVAMNFRKHCGACYYCRNKMEQFLRVCEVVRGRLRRICGLRRELSVLLPDDVSLERGAMLEPVTIAVHAVDLGNIVPGKTVAISGADHRSSHPTGSHTGPAPPGFWSPDPMPGEAGDGYEVWGGLDGRSPEGRPGDRRPGSTQMGVALTPSSRPAATSAVAETIGLADKDGTINQGGLLSRGRHVPDQSVLYVRQ